MPDAPLPTIFEQAWNYQIAGVPVVQLLIVVGVMFGFYLLITRLFKGNKIKPYKPRIYKKELKEYNYEDLNVGFPVNKDLFYFVKLRKVISATFHNGIPKLKKEKDKLVIDESDTEVLIRILKTRPLGWFGWLISKFGFGIKYYSIPDKYITETDKEYMIDKNLDYVIDNGMVIFGEVAKSRSVENPSYLKNRENELEALINWYPRMIYTQEVTALKVAELQEKTRLEKEKFSGQTNE